MSLSQTIHSTSEYAPDYTCIDSPEFWVWQKEVDRAFRQAIIDFRNSHWDAETAQEFLADESYSVFDFDYASAFLSGESIEEVACQILDKLESDGWCL